MIANPEKHRYEGFERRISFMRAVFLAVAALLILRLGYLQIDQGETYADRALSNRIRRIPLRSQRGMIFGPDESIVLASNRAACDLFIVPNECEGHEEEVTHLLERLLSIDGSELLDTIYAHRNRPYTQIPIKRDISRAELTQVEEMSFALPGVFAVVRPQRRYLHGETAGQIMGYLNEIGREELDRMPDYRMGDFIGRSGLEQAYEPVLRGRDGRMVVSLFNMGVPQMRTDSFGNPMMESDQRGRRVVVEARDDPTPGDPIFTTLDMPLQERAEELLRGGQGAIVVMNANTGALLALASVPSYDPNVFVGASEKNQIRQVRDLLTNADGLKRMRHRAIQERYPPGSVFKVMMAVAALEEGLISSSSTHSCGGRFSLGRTSWQCWQRGGHGSLDIVDALAFSCNVYFYHTGLALGIENINKWSALMGLGVTTGIDLPGEIPGLIPSPEWKDEYYAEVMNRWDRQWHRGDTVNLSIGQGHCSVTPLQTAVMMASIINGGRRVTPYINLHHGPRVSEPFISEETLEIVQKGMRKSVTKQDFPSGTGRLAHIEGMNIIGKTGTAQVVSLSTLERFETEDGVPGNIPNHAWFIAGVMDEDPPLAISILVEHGLRGSTGAAPLARDLIEFFYTERAQEITHVARLHED